MSTLANRLLAIHSSLNETNIPHAFGGAIALAYYTLEPRATQDLDINIFVSQEDYSQALESLPKEVKVSAKNIHDIELTGQTRVWWDRTPVDLFFNNHPFHLLAAEKIQYRPFAGLEIPLLDSTSLAVFKIFFNRTKDWADIEAMVEADQLDYTAVKVHLEDLRGKEDPRLERLAEIAQQKRDDLHGPQSTQHP